MNLQLFFDTLAKLYGEKNNLKIKYTLKRRSTL